jgi:transposase, IS5 family
LKIIQEYHRKYDGIDQLLDKNPAILDAFHDDLKRFGCSGGRESKFSSEQMLRMAIVRCVELEPLRKTVIRVNESDSLRNFTRIGMGEVPNFTFLGDALKCIKPETWFRINEVLFTYGKTEEKISGTSLRLDSTVSESNIHYPTDAHLLWDGYRVLSRLMTQIRESDRRLDCCNRFHVNKIKALFTFISTHCGKKNKSTVRKVNKKMLTLIERVEWVIAVGLNLKKYAWEKGCGSIAAYALVEALERMLPLVAQVAAQSRRAWINGETVPAAERIFSIFEEHTELLMRGKTRQPIEFGHLVTLGQTAEKFISYYAVEEHSRHDTAYKDEVLEDHKRKFGFYPDRFTADKNYHVSIEDTKEWEKEIAVYSVGKKGHRNEEEDEREHSKSFRAAQRFRAGCEGSISVLKRAFGLKRCLNRGFKSFAASVGCLVFCHNLVLMALM